MIDSDPYGFAVYLDFSMFSTRYEIVDLVTDKTAFEITKEGTFKPFFTMYDRERNVVLTAKRISAWSGIYRLFKEDIRYATLDYSISCCSSSLRISLSIYSMTNRPKTIGVTGHRNLSHSEEDIKRVLRVGLKHLHQEKGYERVITGMAMGFDTLVAEVCCELDIPFIAAIAFEEQHKSWSLIYQARYQDAISCCEHIEVVCEGGWANWKYLKRDTWIADNCDLLISYWSGQQPSGTYFTMKEALDRKKKVKNIYQLVGG